MKKIVVVSDSHGNRAALEKIDRIFLESDYIFHLGDYSTDGGAIAKKYPDKTFFVNGNCDGPFAVGEKEIITEIEGVKILACHGHYYSVKSGIDRLVYRCEELECQLALYGHTHIPQIDEYENVTLINPGNLTRFGQNSYCYLVINNGKIVAKIVEI